MDNLKIGQRFWTFDIDARCNTWSVCRCKVVRPADYNSAFYYIVEKQDGSSEERLGVLLFNKKKDAEKALVAQVKVIRGMCQNSLLEYTKSIARERDSINFCTAVIEKFDKEAT